MKKQLEFDFMKDYPKEYDITGEETEKAMKDIREDAKAEFSKLMDKYDISREDRSSIYTFANHC